MRLAVAWLLLPCLTWAQFFGNQPNQQQPQQQFGQNGNTNGQHPFQNSQQQSFGQRPNAPQPQTGGIQRTMSQNTLGLPQSNGQQQHPIHQLMQQNHQQQQQQAARNMFPQQGSQPNPQPGTQQQQPSFLQSAANRLQSSIVRPLQSAASEVKSAIARPGAVFNRLANNQANSWSGSSGFNSPGIFATPQRNNLPLNPGATFYLQLSSYTNQGLNMKGGTTCYCPREECTLLENILHPCYFTFTIVVSTASGEPVHYISKEFVQVNSTGQPSPSSGDWTVPVTLQLVSKPTFIDIFVNNLGPVIQGRTVNYLDEFWQVDTFTIDLGDYSPTIANQQPTPVTTRLTGQLVRSSLEVNYYVQCQAGLLGDSCDLQCQPTKQTDPPRSVCTSRITNISSICGMDSQRSQVQNCQICGYGVIDEKCADLAALQNRELGVSSDFRTWTIVLAILLVIALIALCIFIALGVVKDRRQRERESEQRNRRVEPVFNDQPNFAAYDNRHGAGNPLLRNDEWAKPPQLHVFNRPPAAESDSNQSETPRGAGYAQQRREAQV